MKAQKIKLSTEPKTSKLTQYRVSVIILLAGIIFLLGVSAMALVLNNVESFQFELNAKRISAKRLETPDTEFEYLVAKLGGKDKLKNMDLDFETEPEELGCERFTLVELNSVTEILSTETDDSFEGKRFQVNAIVSCATETEIESFSGTGVYEVSTGTAGFELTKLGDSNENTDIDE